MTNNDLLRRLRYAFDLSDQQASRLFSSDPGSNTPMSVSQFQARLAKEEESGFIPCSDLELAAFLDGLIISRRGPRDTPGPVQSTPATFRLSKNDILKKLRIAMSFRDQDMLTTLRAGGIELSKSELGALFRNPNHKHFRTCGNQVLRGFIKGLTLQLRGRE